MNTKDKRNIKRLGDYICRRLREVADEKPNDPWHKLQERQAFQDVLVGMKHYKLIADYDLVKNEVIL